jgi:hypothetical protein
VAEGQEKTVKETYRLPAGLVDYIADLTKLHVLGTNRSAVVRTLLNKAIDQLDTVEYVKKHLESRELLKKL